MKEKIKKVLRDKYNIEAELNALSGYDDQNFLAEVEGTPSWIIKISTNKDKRELLVAENEIFDILEKAQDYHFPRVRKGNDGSVIYPLEDGSMMRVLSYIPGQFLAETDPDDDLLYDMGYFLGYLDHLLGNYRNAGITSRKYDWDLQHFARYDRYLPYVEDTSGRKLVQYYLLQFEEIVNPILRDLRKSTIHNDANDWNVIIDEGQKIKGIIDFGDIVYSPTINELAVACTYMAMETPDPVAKILPLIKGYNERLKLQEKELSILYYLIATRLCISVCQSAYSKKKDPDNQYISIHEERAWKLLEKWISISPDHADNSFRDACKFPRKRLPEQEVLKKERQRYISSALSVSYEKPIIMSRAAFQYMYGDSGRTYLDCVNNIMHVGHCHPEVVRAGQRQMSMLNTNTRYYYKSLNQYADELLSHFHPSLNKVFFVNSGSAATDLALRLARNYTGRKNVIALEHGYHGNTTAAIEISHYKFAGKGGQGPEDYIHIAPIPDTYRGKYNTEASNKYADEITPMLEYPVAAFIAESIVGCGGQIVLPDNYLSEVYQKIRKAGGICIADEVQTGFGRVGTHFWAYEMYDVVPDIVILGKPMGNGHPLAAVVCTDTLAKAFENGMEFFSSFGGNPISCEIGRAVLRVLEEEKLQDHALSTGHFLIDYFTEMKRKYPIIGDVRGSGLFLGLELVRDPESKIPAKEEAGRLINEMKERNILLSTDGPDHNVIKFKPPMCFSLENGRELVHQLEEVLRKIT